MSRWPVYAGRVQDSRTVDLMTEFSTVTAMCRSVGGSGLPVSCRNQKGSFANKFGPGNGNQSLPVGMICKDALT